MSYVIYEAATGRLVKLLQCAPDDLPLNVAAGQSAILGDASNPDTHFVTDGQVIPRPELPAFLAGPAPLALDLTGLPMGARVLVRNADGDQLEVTDFATPLTLRDPGPYRVQVAAPWPWRPLDQLLEVPLA